RPQGTVHPQQRGPVLRELRGVRRGALLARVERPAQRAPRPQRPRVLPPALHMARDRAEVSGDVRTTPAFGSERSGFRLQADGRATPWVVRSAETRPAALARDVGENPQRTGGGTSTRGGSSASRRKPLR